MWSVYVALSGSDMSIFGFHSSIVRCHVEKEEKYVLPELWKAVTR